MNCAKRHENTIDGFRDRLAIAIENLSCEEP